MRPKEHLLTAAVFITIWMAAAPYFATWLCIERPLEHADAIIVLSGSAVYQERVRKAAELYRGGVSSLILLTDDGEQAGWSHGEQTNPKFVDLERRELAASGVPSDAVTVLPGIVAGTDDEAKVFASEAESRQIRSVVIVTSAYHARRAIRTFEKLGGLETSRIGIMPAAPGVFTPQPKYWWITLRGWQMVAGEYIKAGAYSLWY